MSRKTGALYEILLLFLWPFLLLGCTPCSDKVKSESTSPDGALKATAFVRNCGATTDFSTIVSVHRPDNTYRDDEDIVFVAKGQGPLRLEWKASRELTIYCVGCQRTDIARQVTMIGDVDVIVLTR